jgi:nitroimidazol reductase NimA-like FMN-containing flavoprotein (pyridoxamine 5'-phosphate oxidase superfamily)
VGRYVAERNTHMDFIHGQTLELTEEEMVQLLRRARYGRLALAFENEPYAVPISHVFDGERLWFHIAAEGKKTTYLQANPQACFEVDEWLESGWCSVICYGNVALSKEASARKQFIKLATGQEPSDESLQQTDMYVCTLTVDEMTGRKSAGYSNPAADSEDAAPR